MRNIKEVNLKKTLVMCTVIIALIIPGLVLSQVSSKNNISIKTQNILKRKKIKKTNNKRKIASINSNLKDQFPLKLGTYELVGGPEIQNEFMCQEGIYGWYKLEAGVDYPQSYMMDLYHLILPQSKITELDRCEVDDPRVFPTNPDALPNDYSQYCLIQKGDKSSIVILSKSDYGTLKRRKIMINKRTIEMLSFNTEKYNFKKKKFVMFSNCNFLRKE